MLPPPWSLIKMCWERRRASAGRFVLILLGLERWRRRRLLAAIEEGQLRDGDVVFRLGDARVLWGFFPLSRFIARATGSRFSHTGVVAVERGEPVVYDCAATGIQRRPFAFWMQDNIGAFGLKRLKPEQRHRIPGALAYCRRVFEAQVPFDRGFRPDDDRLYCTELVEKAFRSAGLPLSEPVRIGDWKNLGQFPLTTAIDPRRVGLGAGRPDHARSARVRAGRRPPGALGIALAGDGGGHRAHPGPRHGASHARRVRRARRRLDAPLCRARTAVVRPDRPRAARAGAALR